MILNIRAVQLDLARQKKTLDFIRQFIDFAAAHGFNTLALYLVGVMAFDPCREIPWSAE